MSRNAILSGYVTFYRINKCFAKYCFLLMTKCFRGLVEMAPWARFDVRVYSLETPTLEVGLQHVRTYKTWILSSS